jgi:hypothetical protein
MASESPWATLEVKTHYDLSTAAGFLSSSSTVGAAIVGTCGCWNGVYKKVMASKSQKSEWGFVTHIKIT